MDATLTQVTSLNILFSLISPMMNYAVHVYLFSYKILSKVEFQPGGPHLFHTKVSCVEEVHPTHFVVKEVIPT